MSDRKKYEWRIGMPKSACDEKGRPLDPEHPWNAWTEEDWHQEFVRRREKKLAFLEAAFAGGNIGALHEALWLCKRERIPLPDWVTAGAAKFIRKAMLGEAPQGKGRHARWISRYRADLVDRWRYDEVNELRERFPELTFEEACYFAYRSLEGSPAEGGDDAVKKSAHRVRKRTKTDPGRYTTLMRVRLLDFDPKPATEEDIDRLREIREEIDTLLKSRRG